MREPDPSDALTASVKLAVELQLGVDTVELDDRLVDDLGAESFDIMNIVANLEETHDVAVTEEQAVAVETVAELVQLIAGAPRA